MRFDDVITNIKPLTSFTNIAPIEYKYLKFSESDEYEKYSIDENNKINDLYLSHLNNIGTFLIYRNIKRYNDDRYCIGFEPTNEKYEKYRYHHGNSHTFRNAQYKSQKMFEYIVKNVLDMNIINQYYRYVENQGLCELHDIDNYIDMCANGDILERVSDKIITYGIAFLYNAENDTLLGKTTPVYEPWKNDFVRESLLDKKVTNVLWYPYL